MSSDIALILDAVTANSHSCAMRVILHVSDCSDCAGMCHILDFLLRYLMIMNKEKIICSFNALAILIAFTEALELVAEFVSRRSGLCLFNIRVTMMHYIEVLKHSSWYKI